MGQDYTHEHIKVLSEIQHVQTHPSMYIGELKNPNHLVFEPLDNALDEAHAGYANIVGVAIDNTTHICKILDNGRGIPIENNTIPTIATKLFSGGKFEKNSETSAYKIASGLHGIGLVAVTALSDWVNIVVYRDGKKASYRFEDAKLVDEKIEKYDTSGHLPFSTQITFKPSKQYFESLTFEINAIRNRLRLASVHITKLKLALIVDGENEVINCNLDEYFKETLLGGKRTKFQTPIFSLKNKIKDEEVHIKFCWDMDSSTASKQTGCINLLEVNQGTHINRTYDVFRNVFFELAKKEKLSFLKQDSITGIRCHTSLFMYNPEYTSQTKEKLASTKEKVDYLYIGLEEQLSNILNDNLEIRSQLLLFFDTYRKKLSSRKNVIKSVSGSVSRFNTLVDSKLRDCTSHSVEKSELFITEGSSASGSLIQCRNTNYHAVLGLKGKIPNIASDTKDALKNKEIIEIINALGTGIEPDFTLSSLRYGKVIFSCDADSDGAHINTLLMVVFLKLVPELLKNNVIYRAIMPLYGSVLRGNRFMPLYSEEELNKFRKQYPNAKIQRYKGLGEMNPDQLKVCLLDESRQLQLITYPNNPDEIFKLMLDANLKRKLISID